MPDTDDVPPMSEPQETPSSLSHVRLIAAIWEERVKRRQEERDDETRDRLCDECFALEYALSCLTPRDLNDVLLQLCVAHRAYLSRSEGDSVDEATGMLLRAISRVLPVLKQTEKPSPV